MMKRAVIIHYDWLLVGVALAGLGFSVVWFWLADAEFRRIRALPVAVHLVNSIYTARHFPESIAPVAVPWEKPPAQPSGTAWIYDLFTPPVVFYQASPASLVVRALVAKSPVNTSQDIALAIAKPALYRLQLVGYFGELGAYTIVFTNPNGVGPLRAKVGERFADLGISIKHFSVSRVALEHKGHFPAFETVALVELWDERAGRVVTLDSRGPKFSDLAAVNETSLSSDLDFPLSRPATGLVTHKK